MTTESPKKTDEIADEKLDQVAGGVTIPTLPTGATALPHDTVLRKRVLEERDLSINATLAEIKRP